MEFSWFLMSKEILTFRKKMGSILKMLSAKDYEDSGKWSRYAATPVGTR